MGAWWDLQFDLGRTAFFHIHISSLMERKGPGEMGGRVQEIEHAHHETAAHKHRDGPKCPQEQWKRKIECPESYRPEITSPVQCPANIIP